VSRRRALLLIVRHFAEQVVEFWCSLFFAFSGLPLATQLHRSLTSAGRSDEFREPTKMVKENDNVQDQREARRSVSPDNQADAQAFRRGLQLQAWPRETS
jgi:hypothetical protein